MNELGIYLLKASTFSLSAIYGPYLYSIFVGDENKFKALLDQNVDEAELDLKKDKPNTVDEHKNIVKSPGSDFYSVKTDNSLVSFSFENIDVCLREDECLSIDAGFNNVTERMGFNINLATAEVIEDKKLSEEQTDKLSLNSLGFIGDFGVEL